MPNSPTSQQREMRRRSPERRRICAFCGETTALLFCRSDAAKLCLACDREVHATAQLFTKHTRRLLCDACDSSPAVIVCSSHRFVLCQNCDFELHNCESFACSSASHERRPLEGFSGQPSASEIASFVGLDCCKSFGGGEVSDFWAWDAVLSVDQLIVSTGGEDHGFHPMLPLDTLPKDRNSTCGQHKQEMLLQLCELSKSEAGLLKECQPDHGHETAGYDQVFGASDIYQGYQHDPDPKATLYFQGSKDEEALNEAFLSDILFGNDSEEVPLDPDRNSNVGNDASLANNGTQGPARNVAESVVTPSKIPTPEVISADRGSALSRYKEKKRSRRYEKHIRYESRKALAESRIRIKGRFAKISQSNPQIQ